MLSAGAQKEFEVLKPCLISVFMEIRYLFFRKVFASVFGLVVLFSLGCKNPVEEKCADICRFTLNCAAKNANPVLMANKMFQDAQIQCEGTCTMFQSEFITCYEENKDSCEKFFKCAVTSGLFE